MRRLMAMLGVVGFLCGGAPVRAVTSAEATTTQAAAGPTTAEDATPSGILHAAFVCTPGVYNSELMAPFDVLQHSIFRDSLICERTCDPAWKPRR